MMTNCTDERSFSELKLTKNELRRLVMQERLSIEADVLESLDFDDTSVHETFLRESKNSNVCNKNVVTKSQSM